MSLLLCHAPKKFEQIDPFYFIFLMMFFWLLNKPKIGLSLSFFVSPWQQSFVFLFANFIFCLYITSENSLPIAKITVCLYFHQLQFRFVFASVCVWVQLCQTINEGRAINSIKQILKSKALHHTHTKKRVLGDFGKHLYAAHKATQTHTHVFGKTGAHCGVV